VLCSSFSTKYYSELFDNSVIRCAWSVITYNSRAGSKMVGNMRLDV